MIPHDPAEWLSRYLDGDLDEAATRELEDRLDHDPDLRHELDGLRAVRGLLRSTADESAPAELDRLTDPLRMEPPQRPSPPVLRLLATAAVLVIGVGVMVQLARREVASPPTVATAPTPSAASPVPAAAPSTGPVHMADRELVGAVEHLMATPPSPPPLPEPEALQPVGPLPRPPGEVATPVPRLLEADAQRPAGTARTPVRAFRKTATRMELVVAGRTVSFTVPGVEERTGAPIPVRVEVDDGGRIVALAPRTTAGVDATRTLEDFGGHLVGLEVRGLPPGTHDGELTLVPVPPAPGEW